MQVILGGDISLGNTGKVISANLGAGLIHMRRNSEVNPEDAIALKNHLRPDGWLIITGHGETSADNISGMQQFF